MSCAGEDIEYPASGGCGVDDAIGRYERELAGFGEVDEAGVADFLTAAEVALDFDKDIVGAKSGDELIEAVRSLVIRQVAQGALLIAGQGEKTIAVGGKLVPAHEALGFCAAKFSLGDETAEVLVAGEVLD